jgi:hypothetical protein
MDSFFPSWAPCERRYASFLRVHDKQLSLGCNHQPSTFKRRSSWALHDALSRHIPAINSVTPWKVLFIIHSPSTKYSLTAFVIIIDPLFTSYGPVLSLEALSVAWSASVSSN